MNPSAPESPVDTALARPQIFISSDHRGFDQKQLLTRELRAKGYDVSDLGPEKKREDDDFNDAAIKVCEKVLSVSANSKSASANPNSGDPADSESSKNPESSAKGILLCGSAHGVAMQSNRFRGIRAIVAYDENLAKIGREHEDANVLCLSADFVDAPENLKIIETFLTTAPLTDERYARRNRRLDEEPRKEENGYDD